MVARAQAQNANINATVCGGYACYLQMTSYKIKSATIFLIIENRKQFGMSGQDEKKEGSIFKRKGHTLVVRQPSEDVSLLRPS